MKRFTFFLIVITLIGCQRSDKLNTVDTVNSNPQIINLKYFGVVDCTDDPTTMWQKLVTINNQKVFLELNYPKHADKRSLFLMNESTLEALEHIVQKSQKVINNDFNNKGNTQAFIEKQLEEFKTADYEFHKIDQKQGSTKTVDVLLNTIELRSIGIFLVDSENHIILTYYIPKKNYYFSNPLFVSYNMNYDLTGITVER